MWIFVLEIRIDIRPFPIICHLAVIKHAAFSSHMPVRSDWGGTSMINSWFEWTVSVRTTSKYSYYNLWNIYVKILYVNLLLITNMCGISPCFPFWESTGSNLGRTCRALLKSNWGEKATYEENVCVLYKDVNYLGWPIDWAIYPDRKIYRVVLWTLYQFMTSYYDQHEQL